jgi:FkbH-like protein
MESGQVRVLAQWLAEYWRREHSPSAAHFVIRQYEKLVPRLDLHNCRITILRSFTVEPIEPLLRAAAFCGGIHLHVRVSGFNTYMQDVLEPAGLLQEAQPDIAFLAVQTSDIAPELWSDYTSLSPKDRLDAIDRVTTHFRNCIDGFRKRSNAYLVVHNLVQPVVPSLGLLDAQCAESQGSAITRINANLREISGRYEGVYILDYDALVARHGRDKWTDNRKWLTMRLPIAAPYLVAIAEEWLRFIYPLTGKAAKAVAVDLDNTLWGGVLGEDGVQGIQLGGEYPGAGFLELQRALLDLSRRGILLAIVSKNDPDDAWNAIGSHPQMLLRREHFAAHRIGWNNKADSIREIAKELNIGLDAMAFLDDNPVERQLVRMELPDVIVIDLPTDPLSYAQTVRATPEFERLQISEEDRLRTQYYRDQRQREELSATCATTEDFLRSLRQKVEILPASQATIPRIAQLTQKTNQFNLTTKRYSETDISGFASRGDMHVYSLRVTDVFNDNGITGVAILHHVDDGCEIDTFLLSCRVIGRTVETALLSFLCAQARQQGATRMFGWFLPTRKNAPAATFYPAHGFDVIETSEAGTRFSLSLTGKDVPFPEWITML